MTSTPGNRHGENLRNLLYIHSQCKCHITEIVDRVHQYNGSLKSVLNNTFEGPLKTKCLLQRRRWPFFSILIVHAVICSRKWAANGVFFGFIKTLRMMWNSSSRVVKLLSIGYCYMLWVKYLEIFFYKYFRIL